MTKFNKKNKEQLPIIEFLEGRMALAIEQGESVFYYALFDREVDAVRAYFAHKYNVTVEISHQNGNQLVYKFSGWKTATSL